MLTRRKFLPLVPIVPHPVDHISLRPLPAATFLAKKILILHSVKVVSQAQDVERAFAHTGLQQEVEVDSMMY